MPCFGDFEHALLGPIDQVARRQALVAEDRRGDLAPGLDQRAQQRTFAHDGGVGAHIGGGGGIARQSAEVGQAAGVLEPAVALELFGDGDDVAGTTAADQRGQSLEDQAVIGAIEIRRRNDVGNLVPGAAIDQQRTEHRLLGFDRVRRRQIFIARAPPSRRGRSGTLMRPPIQPRGHSRPPQWPSGRFFGDDDDRQLDD